MDRCQRSQMAVTAMKSDQPVEVNVRQAVSIGDAEIILTFEQMGYTFYPAASVCVLTRIHAVDLQAIDGVRSKESSN